MLVSQCPRCHESVCVPDELLIGHGKSADASAKAQCPWCLETLDGSELRAILPPVLVLVGDHSLITSGAASGADWDGGSEDFSDLGTDDGVSGAAAVQYFRDANISLEDHAAHIPSYESEASELDSVDIDQSNDDATENYQVGDRSEYAFQPSNLARSGVADASADNPPQRVIKISVPGKVGGGGDILAPMMDVDSSHGRRRNRKGSPLKTMTGVVLGGLLALPIVGTILHFATGQYIPYMSDILPGGGTGSTESRANQPMSVQYSQPQSELQSGITNLEGQRIDGDIRDVPSLGQLPDPADSALQAITGDATNENTETKINDPKSALPEVAMAESAEADTDSTARPGDGFPAPNTSIPELVADTFEEDLLSNDSGPDSRFSDDAFPVNDLVDNELPTSESGDRLDSVAVLPKDAATGGETDVMAQEDAFDIDDVTPLESLTPNPSPADVSADVAPTSDAEDLFADKTDIPFPTPVVPETPAIAATSLDVDAEVDQLTNSLAQITALATDDPKRGNQIQQLYESLTELAGRVPTESSAKLSPLLDQIAANTSLVIAFAKATPAWVSRSPEDRGGDGVVVVGKMSGDATDATFTLLNRQELPVTLPAPLTEVPSGFQIGLGHITGSGADASLALKLLQSVKQ